MALTYESIASATGTGSSLTVTFSNISSNYTDLVLAIEGKLSQFTGTAWIRLNGDTGTNYSTTRFDLNNAARGSNQDFIALGGANAQNNGWYYWCELQNYSNTNTNKTILFKSGYAGTSDNGGPVLGVALWRNTAAINSITISSNQTAANWTTTSTFRLYGIKAA